MKKNYDKRNIHNMRKSQQQEIKMQLIMSHMKSQWDSKSYQWEIKGDIKLLISCIPYREHALNNIK